MAIRLIDASETQRLCSLAYAKGHGASDEHLGFSLIYYTLACGIHAQTCVCLGSGGGLVPELMRRAQLDLGLIGSRTYLVDAILPEVGFGGCEEENGWFNRRDFLTHLDLDIWPLFMLTEKSAKEFFPKLGRLIDLLHIDADHSYGGAKLDFREFEPLLSEKALITMHDLLMPDIARLVDEIESEGEWSALRFPDIGAGLAILRRKPGSSYKQNAVSSKTLSSNRKMSEKQNLLPETDKKMWNYLTHPALYTRHAIAAQWIGEPDVVLEIGGYHTSISPFLKNTPGEYYLVDPLCVPFESSTLHDKACRVRHINCDIMEFDVDLLTNKKYAVVFWGAHLASAKEGFSNFCQTIERYLRILSSAGTAVIEFPPNFSPASELFSVVLSLLRPKIDFEITLDMSHNEIRVDEQNLTADRLIRRLFVLSHFEPLPSIDETIHQIARMYRGSRAGRLLDQAMMDLVPDATKDVRWTITQENVSLAETGQGIHIKTPPVPWGYAAIFPLNKDAMKPGPFIVKLSALGSNGNVWAAMANQDLDAIGEQSRVASKDGEPIEIEIELNSTLESGMTLILLRTGAEKDFGELIVTDVKVLQ